VQYRLWTNAQKWGILSAFLKCAFLK